MLGFEDGFDDSVGFVLGNDDGKDEGCDDGSCRRYTISINVESEDPPVVLPPSEDPFGVPSPPGSAPPDASVELEPVLPLPVESPPPPPPAESTMGGKLAPYIISLV